MEQTLIWCDFNAEQDELERLFGDKCFSIRGDTPAELKVEYNERWTAGERPVMITKPKCFGFGVNWQHCKKMIFCGLSDSFESYYQAVRRCWRFGQKKPVDVYIITSEAEISVKQNIERKQREAEQMTAELVKYTKDILSSEIKGTIRISEKYIAVDKMILPEWLRSERNAG